MAALLYDPDCGICTTSGRFLARRRLTAEIRPMGPDAASLGVDPERARSEIPFVPDEGPVVYGVTAIASALATGRWGSRLASGLLVTPPISCLAGAVYRLVSGNRHRLPGSTCPLPPA